MPAQDVNPIIRRPSQNQLPKSVEARDVVNYLQKTVMPELRSIRVVIDRMLSGAGDHTVPIGDSLHVTTAAPSAGFVTIGSTPAVLDRGARVVFDASQYSGINLSSTRSLFIEYWLSADVGGSSPQVALFNEASGVQITGTIQSHTGGATTVRYLLGPLTIGTDAADIQPAETVYEIKGRDTATTANIVVEQARFLVRY